jgi:DNA-binding winged helix-turn-helix (wHTH) protein/tetratricopeptide (TPR) repeat protein
MTPPSSPLLTRFGDYLLDEVNARLACNGQPVELAPKAFAVLCTLVREPGQLVVKGALLDAVWGHQHVSESVLKTLVSQLRAALGDDARNPRFIETASRRGYRFIHPLAASAVAIEHPAQQRPEAVHALIGRSGPMAVLDRCLALARAGHPRVVLVAGEPGIGKTTLIDRFVSEAHGVRVASGQCVEHFGGSEPYMPVLEALNLLCRQAQDTLLPLMRQVAPTWLAQLPWYLTDHDRQQLAREVTGATQDRMLREAGELLERAAADQPLLLVLEDLHWSDPATVALVGYLARRRSSARLMLVASYRPTDIILSDHPLKSQRQELRLHRLCEELDLEAFSETEVRDFIEGRFAGLECPDSLVQALHAHTEGLPLFVSSVLDELRTEGVITKAPAGWTVVGEPRQVIPPDIAGLIEKQIARLNPVQQRWLTAASVSGVEFLHAPLADFLQVDADTLQEGLDALVLQHQWLRSAGAMTLPDGRISAKYAFRHALYRHVFYRTAGRAQRMAAHLGLAQALQRAHGSRSGTVAAELAMHFERGADFPQAVTYLRLAAAKALERSAMQEALRASRQACKLLADMPASTASSEIELDLRVMEGVALTHLTSYSAPEVAQAFGRAEALCEVLPANPARARALHGMWWVNFACADLARAETLAARIVALGEIAADDALRLAGHSSMGLTLCHTGRLDGALAHFEAAAAAYERVGAELPPAMFLQDPGVEVMSYRALVWWWKGETIRSRASIAQAVALAEKLNHPLSLAVALHFQGVIHYLAGEPVPAKQAVERLYTLADRHGMWRGPGGHSWVHGWATASLGDVDAGLAEMRAGEANCRRIGMVAGLSAFYVFHAQACISAGRIDEALASIDAGLAFAHERGDLCLVAPMWTLRGHALREGGNFEASAQAYARAIAMAREQNAGHFSVEALAGLAALGAPESTAALAALRVALSSYTGEDSPILTTARLLATD